MQGFGRFSLFPPVIKFLLIANVAMFILDFLFFGQISFGSSLVTDPSTGMAAQMKITLADYLALQPLGGSLSGVGFWPWQIFTYQFMHGDLWHIFFNLFALWMFGTELEQKWGSRKFLVFYLLCGIGAGLLQMFIADRGTVGASGSIFGILLAFGLSFPNRPIFMFPFFIPIPAKFFIVIFGAIQLLLGFSDTSGGVAYFAHIAGAITGFLLLKFGDSMGIYSFFDKFFPQGVLDGSGDATSYSSDFGGGKKEWRIFRADPPHMKIRLEDSYEPPRQSGRTYNIDGEQITQDKIDSILDKISASGYQNLTEKEKYILNELSKKI